MRMRIAISLLTLAWSLTPLPAHAAAPSSLIPIQGKVTDAGGTPLAPGVKSFVFRIFDAGAGGTQIWPSVGGEAQSITSNADGLWTGQLGAVNPLSDAVFVDSVRWLEITVNGLTLSPRIRLLTAPYAMRVATIDGAAGGGVISNMAITSNLYLKGTATGAASGCWVQFNDGAGTAMGYVGDGSDDDQDLYLFAYAGDVNLTTPAGVVQTVRSDGTVGMGTSSSIARLNVADAGGIAIYGNGGSDGFGVYGFADQLAGRAVYGVAANGAYAGSFNGRLDVMGTLTKDAGSFKIDHPLDPSNKYLSHSFVESPDMMNIYNGNVILDANGEATIQLPEWFEALNRDFRYQLTCIGGFAQVYVAEKVKDNRFKIAGGTTGLEVSWQVTGIRQDAYANAHRIPVEEPKPAAERGYYRSPALFNQPEEKQIEWARHPELMKEMKERREKTEAADGTSHR